ncbi:hypothetical protein Tco_1073360, partial [Tanacetum coccineum]
MASMKYRDKHNQVGFLKKPKESTGFAEIVDFLKGSHIRYALAHNPTIHDPLVKQFWQTATALTLVDGTLELRATIDTLEYTITEASVQSKLQLADASGISMLPNTKIFEGMGNMGYPTDGQADQAGTQSQPSSSTVPPPPTSQPAPTESTTIPPTPVTETTSEPLSPSPAPEHETMEHPFEQLSPEHQPSSPRHESAIPQTQAPTHTHEAKKGYMSVDDLFQLVPQLMTRIESLEKDLKQTMGNAIVKLVKKVKKLEKVVKGRRVVLTDLEDEAAENSSKQGRNLQKDESEVFETLKQGKSLGETYISPQGLEAAETLAEALNQIKTKRRNVKSGVRRRLDAEDICIGLEEVSTGFTDIKSASEKVSSGGEHVSATQREGKAVLEETPQTKRTKKQIREQQASLAEIARIQAEEEDEKYKRRAKKTGRIGCKKIARGFYTEEDWDIIRAKLEENADLVKEIAREDISEAAYAQRMASLISQRRKLITEKKAKAQRDKPMTQAQKRQYMATYLKNQGGWKLTQIK